MSALTQDSSLVRNRYHFSRDVPEPILSRLKELIDSDYPIFKIKRCMEVYRGRPFYHELKQRMSAAFEASQLLSSRSVIATPFSRLCSADAHYAERMGITSQTITTKNTLPNYSEEHVSTDNLNDMMNADSLIEEEVFQRFPLI